MSHPVAPVIAKRGTMHKLMKAVIAGAVAASFVSAGAGAVQAAEPYVDCAAKVVRITSNVTTTGDRHHSIGEWGMWFTGTGSKTYLTGAHYGNWYVSHTGTLIGKSALCTTA
jgi:hypothetical protein